MWAVNWNLLDSSANQCWLTKCCRDPLNPPFISSKSPNAATHYVRFVMNSSKKSKLLIWVLRDFSPPTRSKSHPPQSAVMSDRPIHQGRRYGNDIRRRGDSGIDDWAHKEYHTTLAVPVVRLRTAEMITRRHSCSMTDDRGPMDFAVLWTLTQTHDVGSSGRVDDDDRSTWRDRMASFRSSITSWSVVGRKSSYH